jgi:hypothetical protein
MAHSDDGVPPRVEPMTAAPEPSPMEERLRPPKHPQNNGFSEGENIARQALTVRNDGKRR